MVLPADDLADYVSKFIFSCSVTSYLLYVLLTNEYCIRYSTYFCNLNRYLFYCRNFSKVIQLGTNLLFLFFTFPVSGGLQCYIDVEAKTIVTCNELEGFKTCFVKYNDSKWKPDNKTPNNNMSVFKHRVDMDKKL